MKTPSNDRDATAETAAVQQALRIQASLGTASAVEYLKAHGVEHAIIRKVLSSHLVRDGGRPL
jgi:hypothetical protein